MFLTIWVTELFQNVANDTDPLPRTTHSRTYPQFCSIPMGLQPLKPLQAQIPNQSTDPRLRTLT